MSLVDTLNQAIDRPVGGTWLKLRETGQSIVGELIEITERGKTYDGAPVLSRRTGEQRLEWVIKLKVDQPDPQITDDDCIRNIAAGETLQWAITDYMRDAGLRFRFGWGGRLAIVVAKGADSPTSSVEKDGYQIKYAPPTGAPASTINDAITASAPAAPAVDIDALI